MAHAFSKACSPSFKILFKMYSPIVQQVTILLIYYFLYLYAEQRAEKSSRFTCTRDLTARQI